MKKIKKEQTKIVVAKNFFKKTEDYLKNYAKNCRQSYLRLLSI